jgi:LysM repeat protein
MSKKLYVLLALPLVAVLFLSGCLRSASQVPGQASPTKSSPFNIAAPTGLSLVQLYGTQTAQVLATQSGSSPASLTALPSPTPTLLTLGTQPTPNSLTATLPPTGAPTPFGTLPTPTTRFIVPTATPGRPASYTLQSGEFPFCLARRFNVNPSELLTLNNLPANPPLLSPGTVLQIPQTGNPFPGDRALHAHPTTFTVSDPTQTIYGVACYFGDIDPSSIAAANGLVPPFTLHTGQLLNVP